MATQFNITQLDTNTFDKLIEKTITSKNRQTTFSIIFQKKNITKILEFIKTEEFSKDIDKLFHKNFRFDDIHNLISGVFSITQKAEDIKQLISTIHLKINNIVKNFLILHYDTFHHDFDKYFYDAIGSRRFYNAKIIMYHYTNLSLYNEFSKMKKYTYRKCREEEFYYFTTIYLENPCLKNLPINYFIHSGNEVITWYNTVEPFKLDDLRYHIKKFLITYNIKITANFPTAIMEVFNFTQMKEWEYKAQKFIYLVLSTYTKNKSFDVNLIREIISWL